MGKITFNERNYDLKTNLQSATSPLLKTGEMKRFLEQYGWCPVLVERCLNHINSLLLEEMKTRGCEGIEWNLTFRNNRLIICLMSDSVYDKWMELLNQYKVLYINAPKPDSEYLENCIMGIIWIQYMQLQKKIAEKEYFIQNTLTCLEVEPDLADVLYENFCWYREIIFAPEVFSYGTEDEDISEDDYYSMLDAIPDVIP